MEGDGKMNGGKGKVWERRQKGRITPQYVWLDLPRECDIILSRKLTDSEE